VERTVRREEGRINLKLTQKEDLTFALLLNFDRQSDNVDQLRSWLTVAEAELRREAERILYNTMGLQGDEVIYG
jgi:hypothetical protein